MLQNEPWKIYGYLKYFKGKNSKGTMRYLRFGKMSFLFYKILTSYKGFQNGIKVLTEFNFSIDLFNFLKFC